jgi:hypothetical protein
VRLGFAVPFTMLHPFDRSLRDLCCPEGVRGRGPRPPGRDGRRTAPSPARRLPGEMAIKYRQTLVALSI